jgi:hypothetical protein
MLHKIKQMFKERIAYLMNALERLILFSTSHLAGLATTLAHPLAISMSTNDASLYFWKVEWLVTWSIKCDQKDYFSIVGFELFLASSRKQLTATPRSVVSFSRIITRSCSEAYVMVRLASETMYTQRTEAMPSVEGQIACSNRVRHSE